MKKLINKMKPLRRGSIKITSRVQFWFLLLLPRSKIALICCLDKTCVHSQLTSLLSRCFLFGLLRLLVVSSGWWN